MLVVQIQGDNRVTPTTVAPNVPANLEERERERERVLLLVMGTILVMGTMLVMDALADYFT